MRRIVFTLTALATLLAGLAAPAAARQPEDLVPFLDIALAAQVQAAERALQVVSDPPGQSEDKLQERLDRYQARLDRFADKAADGIGSERSMEVHALLADGCNPGKGIGKKLGHAKEGHTFAGCELTGTLLPPGQLKEKPDEDDDPDDD